MQQMGRGGCALGWFYRTAAVWIVNTVIVFVLFNLLVSLALSIIDTVRSSTNPVSLKYHDSLASAYPDFSPDDLNRLLRETWSRPFLYEPFTQFKESPFKGSFVTVHPEGFRSVPNQAPWPPARERFFTIFLFGGSTTFNYGLPDHQTIAHDLQELLGTLRLEKTPKVYNFGRGFYFSTQERILFEQLLTAGFIPDMAIFIDGLNEFFYPNNEPHFTGRLAELFAKADPKVGSLLSQLVSKLPIARAARRMRETMSSPSNQHDMQDATPHSDDDPLLHRVIDRYFQSTKLINHAAAAYAVQPVFVWQPIPWHKYDLRFHLFAPEESAVFDAHKFGYSLMASSIAQTPPGQNFLWCADIQENSREPLYVDIHHYSSKGSALLANCIFDLMKARGLVPKD